MTEFCSLGTTCHSARMMQRLRVKHVSYPFDWIFSDETMIQEIIEDDFEKFMNPKYFTEPKNKFNERQCGHQIYHEDLFFHKNPKNKEDYDYYLRCIERFKNLLKSPEHKCFFMFYNLQNTKHPDYLINKNNQEIIEIIKNKVIKFNDFFKTKTTNYKLATIIIDGENKEHSFKLELNNEISFFSIKTLSNSTGVTFQNNTDNIYLSGLMREHFW